MKTRGQWEWRLGTALFVLCLAGGYARQASGSPEQTAAITNEAAPLAPSPATLEPASEGSGPLPEEDAAEPEISSAPFTPVSTARSLPETIRSTGPLAEVIKLASSGVDESVMLAFVTNSTGAFNLTSDEIIYLNDLGVPTAVVTAMIARDSVTGPTTGSAPISTPAAIAETPTPETAPSSIPSESELAPAPAVAADYGAGGYAATAPVVQPAYATFHNSLSPYGTWVNVDGYGLGWQPTVAVLNASWQPYCDGGRWLYTDSGWYWASDYSWGWAPFHYGRWFRHQRLGWLWTPDTVWGPSWVSWRYNNAYVGWAPLPPGAHFRPGFGFSYHGRAVRAGFHFPIRRDSHTFIAWSDFRNRTLHHRALPRDHANRIYDRTLVSDRVVGNNNTIIHTGISSERVAAATRAPIHKVAIRDASAAPTRGTRAERLDNGGRTLTVFRPQLPQVNRIEPMRDRSRAELRGQHAANPARAAQNPTPNFPPRAAVAPTRPASIVPSTARQERQPADLTPARYASAPGPARSANTGPRTDAAPRPTLSGSRSVAPQTSPAWTDSTVTRSVDGRTPASRGAPIILRGSDLSSQSGRRTASVENAPRNSLIVIGKRDPARQQAVNPAWSATREAPRSQASTTESQARTKVRLADRANDPPGIRWQNNSPQRSDPPQTATTSRSVPAPVTRASSAAPPGQLAVRAEPQTRPPVVRPFSTPAYQPPQRSAPPPPIQRAPSSPFFAPQRFQAAPQVRSVPQQPARSQGRDVAPSAPASSGPRQSHSGGNSPAGGHRR